MEFFYSHKWLSLIYGAVVYMGEIIINTIGLFTAALKQTAAITSAISPSPLQAPAPSTPA